MGLVTAAAAAPVTAAVESKLKAISFKIADSEAADLKVSVGSPPPSKTWAAPGLLSDPNKLVNITVTVMAADDPLSTPPVGEYLSPQDVLDTPWHISGANDTSSSSGTLGTYFSAKYGVDYGNLAKSSTTIAGINGACANVASDVGLMELSPRDGAVLLCAIVHILAAGAIEASATFNSDVACLSGVGTYVRPQPQPHVDVVAKAPPTIQQMQDTTLPYDSLTDFFVLANWSDKEALGTDMFDYSTPLIINDPAHVLIQHTPTDLKSNDAWLSLYAQRDHAMLSHLACYVPMAYNESQANLASSGTKSIMLGLGALPPSAAGKDDGKELAFTFSFSPVAAGNDPQIGQIDISDSLTADQKTVLTDAFPSRANPGKQACGVTWKPKLLFGVTSTGPAGTN